MAARAIRFIEYKTHKVIFSYFIRVARLFRRLRLLSDGEVVDFEPFLHRPTGWYGTLIKERDDFRSLTENFNLGAQKLIEAGRLIGVG